MKYVLFITTVLFAGCIQKVSADIEGTYTRESVGEYSRAWDTLEITRYNTDGSTFLVHRKTGFIRFKEGVPQEKQWREEKMISVFDRAKNQLEDNKTGRLFSFKEGELVFGTAMYKKAPGP